MLAGKGSLPDSLQPIKQEWEGCTKCELHKTRRNLVFGEAYGKRPIILLIGEAPGEDEDRRGLPFCGVSGNLLWQFITRHKLAPLLMITNIVACRPPGNRMPYVDEVNECRPRFEALIAQINPFLIVTAGAVAASRVQKRGVKILSERGKLTNIKFSYDDSPEYLVPTMPVLHPAFLLRDGRTDSESWLKKTYDDFGNIARMAKEFVDCHIAARDR